MTKVNDLENLLSEILEEYAISVIKFESLDKSRVNYKEEINKIRQHTLDITKDRILQYGNIKMKIDFIDENNIGDAYFNKSLEETILDKYSVEFEQAVEEAKNNYQQNGIFDQSIEYKGHFYECYE